MKTHSWMLLLNFLIFEFSLTQGQVIYEPYTFTTIAGSPKHSGNVDGNGSAARFSYPRGVAVDAAGNIYVADSEGYTIRQITPAGMVTTLAGSRRNAPLKGSPDGIGRAAWFFQPYGVAVDNSGTVFVSDLSYHIVRKITAGGIVTTLAGELGRFGLLDGIGTAARFWSPYGIAVDNAGNVYIGDFGNIAIRKISSSGVVTTLSRWPNSGASVDNGLNPSGIAVDASGTAYVTEGDVIRVITPTGSRTILAGARYKFGYADGPGTTARFGLATAIALDNSGNLLVADKVNCTIRKVTLSGFVTTLAGLAQTNGTADGTGMAVRFNNPDGIAVDTGGNIYVADTENHTIRKGVPAGGTLAPSFSGQPQSLIVVAGTNVTLTVSVNGLSPFSFQWRNGGTPIIGATNAFLTLTNVQFTDGGVYDVVVENIKGTTNSSLSTLTIAPLIID